MCTALAVAIRSLADLCCVFLLLCGRNPRNQNTDEIFVANLRLKVARKTRLCLSMNISYLRLDILPTLEHFLLQSLHSEQ